MNDVMTLEEVTAYLRCHRSTVYKLLRKHDLPHFRVGSDYRFRRDALLAWCAAQEAKETQSR